MGFLVEFLFIILLKSGYYPSTGSASFSSASIATTSSHILRQVRHVNRRQPRHHAEPAGNKRQHNHNRNGMEQQQDAEDDADGPQDAVAGIL